METAEPAPASLGPRYAPEDPTLPKPWKGLIDGSTNILYYWNPETNVTQYERPVPPLPSGPPPVASTPKLAPLPMTSTQQSNGVLPQQGQHLSQTPASQTSTQQSNGILPQQGQYMCQTPASQMRYSSQSEQQQGYPMHHQQQQISQTGQQQQQVSQTVQTQGYPLNHQQQQGSQTGQAVQQNGLQGPQQASQMAQSMQQPVQLLQRQGGQQMLQHPAQQIPQHLGQQMPQHQGHQMPVQQGQQYPHQPLQQMPYQQNPHQQSPQMSHPHAQQFSHQQGQHYQPQQGQQFPPQQVQTTGFPQRGEDTDFHPGKQIGVSPSQSQPSGVSSLHNMPHGAHSVQMLPMGSQSYQPQQFGNTSINVPHTGSSFVKLPQAGKDSTHQQHIGGSMIQNQTGPMVHNHQSGGTPIGVKMGSAEDLRGRPGNDFYYNANKERQVMAPQQRKPLAGPMDRNHQDARMMGVVPPQNAPPNHSGGLNMGPGSGMPDVYNHVAGGQAFPSNNASLRPPAGALPSSDATNPSTADAYRRQHEVTATGDDVPAPFMTFEATGFPPEILRELAGFSTPTPIQAQTWPIALQHKDIVAIAKTGSGKTLGYLIPAFIHLRQIRNDPLRGPTVLVLAPTRELATQIQDEALKFGRSSRVSCTCLYGGAPKGLQIKELDRGADIVVATPGRLNDILEMKKIDFRQVSLLVLDEADRMLDMGFEPQIRKIVNEIPPRRQTLMYTATWPKEVRKIAADLLVHPVQVNIGNVDELAANKSITQHVEVVHQMQKQRRVEQILRAQDRGSKVIIFCSTKRLCDQLARSIGRTFGAAAIHGDKSQGERDYVLNQFRTGKSPVLVATDVAARGLDIKDIRVVINYDFPTGIEDYVHRIGRTGRAGATGISYTFFSEHDSKYAADLIKLLEGADQRVPPEVQEIAASFARGRGGGRWSGGDRDGGRCGFREDGFGGRGGRMEYFGGRGNRGQGRGFCGGRYERGPQDRYERGPQDRYMDRRRRFDDRRGSGSRSRGRSYSRSPERVRTWGYSRSRSRSRSGTRSRSRSWSRSRSRTRSYSRGRSRSRSWSQDRYKGSKRQKTDLPPTAVEVGAGLEPKMSPMYPGTGGGGGSGNGVGPQVEVQVPLMESTGPELHAEPV